MFYFFIETGMLENVKANGGIVKSFTYNNGILTKVNNNDIIYDRYGNITKIGDVTIKYNSRGLMESYSYKDNSNNQVEFKYYYNYQGARYKKEKYLNSVIKEDSIYYLNASTILGEDKRTYNNGQVQTTKKLRYYYDAEGICGVKYDNKNYVLVKDPLGNVSKVMCDGYIIGEYLYDAWGNHYKVDANTSSSTDKELMNNNPFRYKGYYYDVETGLFWLSSRYYSPELCRFISPDDIEYLDPESVNGLNLYCYCGNDPVNRYDPTGHFWDVVFDIGSILWSAYDFIKDPSWENLGWLALDVGFAVVPFLTGSGGLKAVSKMDDLYDLSKITSSADEIYMLGQSMGKRVIPEAINLGVDWYHGFDYYNDMAKVSKSMANLYGYIDNMAFIANKAFDGVKFIDMGFDATRTLKGARKGGKLGVELLSRFTIYSERFVAIAFRKKNLARMMRRFYKWLF